MALILLTVFLDVLGVGLIVPIGPFYAESYGANALQVGLLFTAFAGAQFLAIPILGALSDRLGRRPIILVCLVGEAVGYILFGFANSLALLYVARLVSGAASGNIGAAQAYIADITQPRDRTRAFGLMGAMFGAGFLVGPAVGGALSGISLSAPAFAAAGMVGLNMLCALRWLPESLPPELRTRNPIHEGLNPFGVLVDLSRRPILRVPLLVVFLCNFAFSAYQANFAIFTAARFNWGPANVSVMFVVQGVFGIVIQSVLVRRAAERYADTSLLTGGVLVTMAGYLLTSAAMNPILLVALAAPIMSLGSSFWRAPSASLISKLVGVREQGLGNGGGQATQALGSVVGPLYSGFVYDHLGQSSPYWTSALVMGCVALMVAFAVRRQPGLRVVPTARHTGAAYE